MAAILKNRVYETTSGTGTGNFVLSGAIDASYVTFASVCANGDTFNYVAVDDVAHTFEVGSGTYVSASNAIARATPESSSNAGALVNFSTAPKVFLAVSAAQTVVDAPLDIFYYARSGGSWIKTVPAGGGTFSGTITAAGISSTTSIFATTSITAASASLTTPLPIASGGTAGATAAAARSSLVLDKVAFDVDFSQGAIVANGTIIVLRKSPFPFTINSLDYEVGSAGGSFTVAVVINATNVTGLSAVAVSSATSANATASAANSVVAGDKLSVIISATSGSPTGANLQINGTR